MTSDLIDCCQYHSSISRKSSNTNIAQSISATDSHWYGSKASKTFCTTFCFHITLKCSYSTKASIISNFSATLTTHFLPATLSTSASDSLQTYSTSSVSEKIHELQEITRSGWPLFGRGPQNKLNNQSPSLPFLLIPRHAVRSSLTDPGSPHVVFHYLL